MSTQHPEGCDQICFTIGNGMQTTLLLVSAIQIVAKLTGAVAVQGQQSRLTQQLPAGPPCAFPPCAGPPTASQTPSQWGQLPAELPAPSQTKLSAEDSPIRARDPPIWGLHIPRREDLQTWGMPDGLQAQILPRSLREDQVISAVRTEPRTAVHGCLPPGGTGSRRADRAISIEDQILAAARGTASQAVH